jgi:single-stranded-DNA-specific exonuclease
MQWRFLQEKVPHSLEEVQKILLENRHILDTELFFTPPNPINFSAEELGVDVEMLRIAKQRILKAIEKKEKIIVFGDYDADGISATAILWTTLHALGAQAMPFIPHREKHGYGLTWAALQEIYQGTLPSLIITVDTGIVAHKAVEELKAKGIDVIITDHHQPEETFPPADAVVHSTQICGSAVSWVLARELKEDLAESNLDLVGLATVTDLMSLKGVNRAFVAHGLRILNLLQRPGLVALQKVAGLEGKKLDAGHIGFALGPRLNAMGRLSYAMDALRLLCTSNPEKATKLASLVDNTNGERQQLTEELSELAHQQARAQKQEHILVVHAPEFHEGVIGLIAGKLTERYSKPTIVISTRGDVAKASARSLPGINITEIIRTARDLLLEFGGHPMAAGFGFEPKNLNAVVEHLLEYGRNHINPDLLQKTLNLECLLPLDLVSVTLVEELKKFGPFGQENPEPLFAFQDIRIAEILTMGNQQQHLKLILKDAGSDAKLTVLAWGKGELAESLEVGMLVNAACVLQINEWRDRKSVQAIMKDMQFAEVM